MNKSQFIFGEHSRNTFYVFGDFWDRQNEDFYIDINDEFDLFSIITGEKTKLIIVEDKELEVTD